MRPEINFPFIFTIPLPDIVSCVGGRQFSLVIVFFIFTLIMTFNYNKNAYLAMIKIYCFLLISLIE